MFKSEKEEGYMMYQKRGIVWFCLLLTAMLILTACKTDFTPGTAERQENAETQGGVAGESVETETDTLFEEDSGPEDAEGMDEGFDDKETENGFRTAREVVSDMDAGWNAGNSLDSYGDWINGSTPTDYETAWGNPVITKELIQSVKSNGFDTVRIPVTYLHFMNEEGQIDEVWLSRVKEVVDYVIAEDMYCIIDIHHDTGASDSAWIVADPYRYENGMKDRFAYVWQQIAEYFKDYDDRLLFEGMNEVLDASWNWGGSTSENYEVVNQLNQVFVDTVRATGGNNAERNLIVVAYGNSSHESQISGFQVPTDSAEGHLIIGIHVYEPDAFCNGQDMTWDAEDEVSLGNTFDRINTSVVQKYQLPVIISEFGARDTNDSQLFREERAEFATCFTENADRLGICCIWWDDGWNMKLFDRITVEPYDMPTIEALTVRGEM